jgi:ACT domain-containing protein
MSLEYPTITRREKLLQVKALIDGGEMVYKACNQVGLDISTWYRYHGSNETRKLRLRKIRLELQRQKLIAQTQRVLMQIADTEVLLKTAEEIASSHLKER